MSTFHIENFGCRATQADSAAIERQLRDRGFVPADSASAGVIVINTCTVTSDADAVARQSIRALHRANPSARIVVTGCYAQRAPEELAQIEGVSWVVGNSHKPEIPALVAQPLLAARVSSQVPGPPEISLAIAPARILTGDIFAPQEFLVAPVLASDSAEFEAVGHHTRPILKVQDGCDYRCSYCVIPFVRGRSRSLPPAQVVEEIRKLCAQGFKEIVLSGISLGSYGRDLAPRADLADLTRRILDETPLQRLRLSSVEPMDVTQDLVDLFAASPRIARHFHIPLQSASNRILAAMHRWYRVEHYARRLAIIQERLPGAAIGADIITGFPSETEDDHRATLAFIEQQPFTYLHVFSFSKRPGTAAENLPDELPVAVVKRRSKELRALAAAKSAAFRASQAGSTLRVLTLRDQGEDSSGPWTAALSDNYLQLRIPGLWPRNKFLTVRLAANGAHLIGYQFTEAKDN